MILFKASTMKRIASLYTGSNSTRSKQGDRINRPVYATVLAVVQQALFTCLCRIGISVHEAISIGHHLDEIARKRPESILVRIGIVKYFNLA